MTIAAIHVSAYAANPPNTGELMVLIGAFFVMLIAVVRNARRKS